MDRGHPLQFARGTVTFVIVGALLLACSGSSPRPDTKASPPPVPAGSTPLGRVSWSTVDVPAGLGDSAHISDAASGPDGFVLVGDSGAFGFEGIVLVSTDGHVWQVVRDEDLKPWGLSKVTWTGAGYVAVAGRFADQQPDGSTAWQSAILTSPDGTDWTVRQTFDGVDIGSVAARGALIIATTDAASLVVSRDSGATWHQILGSGIGFGTGSPTSVGVLGNGRWVAVGTAGTSAAAWSSADGLTWEAATMEAADPTTGIQSVTPYAIAAGTSIAIAAGTDDPTDCAPGDDFCGHWGAGWVTQDGLSWMRLPRGTPLTEGTGAFIWPAGDAGVLAAGMGLSQSPNGWSWTAVSGDGTAILPLAVTFRGRTMVAAGLGTSSDKPGATIWVGTIAEP